MGPTICNLLWVEPTLIAEVAMSTKSETCISKATKNPLTEYLTEVEAEVGANYAKINHGRELAPYQCEKCRKWHLSPTERQTPSEPCEFCQDSYGDTKSLYFSEESAQRRANILEREKNIYLRVYPCPYQHGWHLTHT